MPVSRQKETSQDAIQINTGFYYLLWYYMVANLSITVSAIFVLDGEGKLSKLLHGLLFFKFLFVFLSTTFCGVLILKKSCNQFGPGTTYLCGLYFAIFTAAVYYKMIVTAWYTESLDDIWPNFLNMLKEIGSELDVLIKSPLEYMKTINVFIGLLIFPTPIFGVIILWLSYQHYSRLTRFVKEVPEPSSRRKYGGGKFKYH